MSGPHAPQRILSLDVAKGLGIVLVVLGHNAVFREEAHSLYEAIYLFHMPLFFFLSGLTFRLGPPREVLVKRARALLVPYFVMGALAVLMAFPGSGVDGATSELLGVLYGTGHTLRFVPLWFLPCLFVVSMSATILLTGLRAATIGRGMPVDRFEKRSLVVLCSLAIVALGVGSLVLVSQRFAQFPYADASGRPLGLPWSLDLLPFVLGLFIVGTLAARVPLVHRCPQPWIVMLATAGVLAVTVSWGVSLDLNYRRMTSPFGVLVAMSAGVMMVLAASTLISRVRWAARLFGYLGSASLIVLMLHSPLQRRVLDALSERDVMGAVAVAMSVVVTIGLIAAFDGLVLRRGRLRMPLSAARRLRASSPPTT